jgi:hypothetical protein
MLEVMDSVCGMSDQGDRGSFPIPKVAIFTDSKSCIERLRSMKPSNEKEIQLFYAVGNLAKVSECHIYHVKSHQGTDVNEKADEFANLGLQLQFKTKRGCKTPMYHDDIKSFVKKQLLAKRVEFLKTSDSPSVQFYTETIRCRRSDPMWKQTLPRRIQLLVNRVECGSVLRWHNPTIDSSDYIKRCCNCCLQIDERKGADVNHLLFECEELNPERKKWTDSLGIENLRGVRRGALFSAKNYNATTDYLLSALFREKRVDDESAPTSDSLSRETVDNNIAMFCGESDNSDDNTFESLSSVDFLVPA